MQRGSPELLAAGQQFDLHDGRFDRVEMDRTARTVTLIVNCGDLDVGYRRLALTFRGAEIVSRNLRAVAEAVSAEFRGNHWHREGAVTEIVGQTVDALPDGRHRLRLDLDPFGRLTVVFETFDYRAARLTDRGPARAGRFIATG